MIYLLQVLKCGRGSLSFFRNTKFNLLVTELAEDFEDVDGMFIGTIVMAAGGLVWFIAADKKIIIRFQINHLSTESTVLSDNLRSYSVIFQERKVKKETSSQTSLKFL